VLLRKIAAGRITSGLDIMHVSSSLRRIVLLGLIAAPFVGHAQSASLPLDQIVARMRRVRAAERDGNPGYTVTREYVLAAADAKQSDSDVIAEISFVPPGEKQYSIVKAEGSERGAGIVRKVLEHEVTMAGRWQLHDVSTDNYNFALVGRETLEGRDCYVLQLSPKREAVELIRGRAWVDAKNFDILRVAGETAKSPSIWLKKLTVTMNFGHVNGVWLETSTRAVADVRLAGPHVLNSHELDVQPNTLSARAQAPEARGHSRSHISADTAAWVAH
jgi:hypothetical protein